MARKSNQAPEVDLELIRGDLVCLRGSTVGTLTVYVGSYPRHVAQGRFGAEILDDFVWYDVFVRPDCTAVEVETKYRCHLRLLGRSSEANESELDDAGGIKYRE